MFLEISVKIMYVFDDLYCWSDLEIWVILNGRWCENYFSGMYCCSYIRIWILRIKFTLRFY